MDNTGFTESFTTQQIMRNEHLGKKLCVKCGIEFTYLKGSPAERAGLCRDHLTEMQTAERRTIRLSPVTGRTTKVLAPFCALGGPECLERFE